MSELSTELSNTNTNPNKFVDKSRIVDDIEQKMTMRGYTATEIDCKRPWGAFLKFSNDEADMFVDEFFPGLSPVEARLGSEGAELSPKILVVSPGQRLSWQYHDRRAERWVFLTKGHYVKSDTDDETEARAADIGDVVQFSPLERHRLIGDKGGFTVVAEIWQHSDPDNLSDEDDIVRLSDDYSRQ